MSSATAKAPADLNQGVTRAERAERLGLNSLRLALFEDLALIARRSGAIRSRHRRFDTPTQDSLVWVVLTWMTMPDTKAGRERKGRNKRRQLESRLNRRELDAADEPPEPTLDEIDSQYLTGSDERDR